MDPKLSEIDALLLLSQTVLLCHVFVLKSYVLNLRFCHGDEVNLKRQKFIRFKQTYYARQDHLKNKGQKFHSVLYMEQYI